MSSRRLTKRELAELEAERAYWQELADLVGWRLHGWSGFSASFFTGEERENVYIGDPLYDAVVPQASS